MLVSACSGLACVCVCVRARARVLEYPSGVLMVQVPQQMAGNAEEAAVLTDANDIKASDATDADTRAHTVSVLCLELKHVKYSTRISSN